MDATAVVPRPSLAAPTRGPDLDGPGTTGTRRRARGTRPLDPERTNARVSDAGLDRTVRGLARNAPALVRTRQDGTTVRRVHCVLPTANRDPARVRQVRASLRRIHAPFRAASARDKTGRGPITLETAPE